jgi:hypothetical protein
LYQILFVPGSSPPLSGTLCAVWARAYHLGARLATLFRASPLSRLLAEIPGVGPVTAVTAALTIDPSQFCSGWIWPPRSG